MKDTLGMSVIWFVITAATMGMAALIGDANTVYLGLIVMGVFGAITIGITFIVELVDILSSISWFWIAFPFERRVHHIKNGPGSPAGWKMFWKDFLGFTIVGQYK